MDESIPRSIIIPGVTKSFETDVCPKCPLFKRRQAGQYVPGAGSPTPRLIIIGEAPGENEVRRQVPFIGRAGEVLSAVNLELGLLRDDIYLTNAVKCRPANNETPPTEAVQLCRDILEDELAKFANQDVRIVTLGNVPLRAATLDYRKTITKSRAKWVDMIGPGFSFKTMPTFHPAYILRNPNMRRFMQDDIRRALYGIGLVDPKVAIAVPPNTLIRSLDNTTFGIVLNVFSGDQLILDIETNNQLNPIVPNATIGLIGLMNERRAVIQLEGPAIRQVTRQFLSNYNGLLIGHNIVQFDIKWLMGKGMLTWKEGLSLKVFDTLYAWKLEDDNRPAYTLASAAIEFGFPDYKGLYLTDPYLYNLYDLLVTRSLFDALQGGPIA